MTNFCWFAASPCDIYTTKIPAHHRISAWPRKPHRCWMSRTCWHFLPLSSLLADAPTLLSNNNLSLPSSSSYTLSLCPPSPAVVTEWVCVWMSSLQKDVLQFHIVFHPPDWTETSQKHPDAFEQKHDGCASMQQKPAVVFSPLSILTTLMAPGDLNTEIYHNHLSSPPDCGHN